MLASKRTNCTNSDIFDCKIGPLLLEIPAMPHARIAALSVRRGDLALERAVTLALLNIGGC